MKGFHEQTRAQVVVKELTQPGKDRESTSDIDRCLQGTPWSGQTAEDVLMIPSGQEPIRGLCGVRLLTAPRMDGDIPFTEEGRQQIIYPSGQTLPMTRRSASMMVCRAIG